MTSQPVKPTRSPRTGYTYDETDHEAVSFAYLDDPYAVAQRRGRINGVQYG